MFILPLFLLSACVTQQKCQRKYPPKLITKDSIVPRLIYVPVHDSIPVYFPPDTIRDSVPVPCKNGKVKDVDLTKENDYAKAHAYTRGGKLYLDLMQKDTTIQRMFSDSIQAWANDHFHSETTIEPPVVKWKVHWYHKYSLWVVLIELVIIGIRYGKSIIKFVLKFLV